MMNVFVVGDELTAGWGDPKALGWAGRVAARTLPLAPDIRFHILAVPGETTGETVRRWDEETLRRTTGDTVGAVRNHVVFAVGRADVRAHISGTMTRLNLANALDRAMALGMKAMLVGPPPSVSSEDQAVAELAAICQDAASRRGVPYVDMYGPLARHDQWLMDMSTSRDGLPGQAGYGLMAWLVLHARWHAWLGVADPEAIA